MVHRARTCTIASSGCLLAVDPAAQIRGQCVVALNGVTWTWTWTQTQLQLHLCAVVLLHTCTAAEIRPPVLMRRI